MPRDVLPVAEPVITRRLTKRERREWRVSRSRRQPQDALLAVASSLRAEFFSIANRLHVIRKHGELPYDRKLRGENMACMRAANQHSAKVLP